MGNSLAILKFVERYLLFLNMWGLIFQLCALLFVFEYTERE